MTAPEPTGANAVDTGVTYVFIARVPADGIDAFQDYERTVLPLLERHGGRLDRRLRSADEQTEVHVIWFPTPDALTAFRTDPDRTAAVPRFVESGAATELLELHDVR
jgi:hypothetical protein